MASDKIAREVERTRGKKPIIAAIAAVAASGGYYVAAPTDRIFAQDLTITGSIGIFSGKFDVSGLLQKVGVTWETTTRGKRADAEGPFRPYTEEERAVVMQKLRHFYDAFLDIVGRNRKMTHAQVDKVARGHVWIGGTAKEKGLVDEIGGLPEAIAEARKRAGYGSGDELEIEHLPRKRTTLGRILREALDSGPTLSGLARLPVVKKLVETIPASLLLGGEGVYARLPFMVVIP
jgi:protease-4